MVEERVFYSLYGAKIYKNVCLYHYTNYVGTLHLIGVFVEKRYSEVGRGNPQTG
ncbi:hypothetical protein ABID39_001545 [Bartonella japonica]|uniref:Uncharacterized protein n=1 Tax=Bartonella japonica TaxID=357761 RepID=A0ABV2FQI3_9HYPH